MRTIIIVLMALLLNACSTIEQMKSLTNNRHSEPDYDLKAAWTNQPIIDLEKHPAFGVPTQKATISDGSTAYVYQFYGNLGVRSKTYAYAEVEQTKCTFTFYSKDNVITDVNMAGECRQDKARMPL